MDLSSNIQTDVAHGNLDGITGIDFDGAYQGCATSFWHPTLHQLLLKDTIMDGYWGKECASSRLLPES